MSIDINPVTVKANLTADVTKPIETITNSWVERPSKGITKFFRAFFAPLMAKWEGDAAITRAEKAKEVAAILCSQNKESTLVSYSEYFKNKKDLNVLLTLASAADQLACDPSNENVSDEPLNGTFQNQWQQTAEILDDKYLRTIWAKLLVEEVKTANSISRRTLDTVKNLTKEEAKLFHNIIFMSFINGKDRVILKNKKLCPINGSIDDIQILRNADLISPTETMYPRFSYSKKELEALKDGCTTEFGYGCYKTIMFLNREKIVDLPVFYLTTAGSEIANILSIPECDTNLDNMAISFAQTQYSFFPCQKLLLYRNSDNAVIWDSENNT